MLLGMKSAFRTVTVAHLLAFCPVLFTGCGGNEGGSNTSTPTTAPSAQTGPAAVTTIRNVDAKAAQQLLSENSDIQVLDVRTPEEYAAGHLAGARNLDFNAPEFRENLSKLDRDKTYLVHCGAGGRSTRSLSRFKDLGFKSVIHLDGGFNGWVEAGQAIENPGRAKP